MSIIEITKYLFMGMTAITIAACTHDDNEPEQEKKPVTLQVKIDNGSTIASSRATIDDLTTTFVAGDTIGIFVAYDGYDISYNIPYVYDGENWTLADDTKIAIYSDNYDFYAYYPYNKDLAGYSMPWDTDDDTIVSADEFFENIISEWTIQTDQSTVEKYNANDLMIGKGTITDSDNGTVSFNLEHQMGLVRITIYDGTKATTAAQELDDISSFDSNILFNRVAGDPIPYNNTKYFYYIAKPREDIIIKNYIDRTKDTLQHVNPVKGMVTQIELTYYVVY